MLKVPDPDQIAAKLVADEILDAAGADDNDAGLDGIDHGRQKTEDRRAAAGPPAIP